MINKASYLKPGFKYKNWSEVISDGQVQTKDRMLAVNKLRESRFSHAPWSPDAPKLLTMSGVMKDDYLAKMIAYRTRLLLSKSIEEGETNGVVIVKDKEVIRIPADTVEAIFNEDEPIDRSNITFYGDTADALSKVTDQEILDKVLSTYDVTNIIDSAISTAASAGVKSGTDFVTQLSAQCDDVIKHAGMEAQVLYKDIKSDILAIQSYSSLQAVNSIVNRLSSQDNTGEILPDVSENEFTGLTGCGAWVALGNLLSTNIALVGAAIGAIGTAVLSIVSPVWGTVAKALINPIKALIMGSKPLGLEKAGDTPVLDGYFAWHKVTNRADFLNIAKLIGEYTICTEFGYVYYKSNGTTGQIGLLPFCYSNIEDCLRPGGCDFIKPVSGAPSIVRGQLDYEKLPKDRLFDDLDKDKVSNSRAMLALFVAMSPLIGCQTDPSIRDEIFWNLQTNHDSSGYNAMLYESPGLGLPHRSFFSSFPSLDFEGQPGFGAWKIRIPEAPALPDQGPVDGQGKNRARVLLNNLYNESSYDTNLGIAKANTGSILNDLQVMGDITYWDYAFAYAQKLILESNAAVIDELYFPNGFVRVKSDNEQAFQVGAGLVEIALIAGSAAVAAGKFAYKRFSRKKAQTAIKNYNDVLYRQDPPPTAEELVKAQKKMDRWSRRAGYAPGASSSNKLDSSVKDTSYIAKLIEG